MPRSQVVLSVLGALVGLALAVVLFRQVGPSTSLSAQVRGYDVRSATETEVVLDVAREPGSTVTCTVRARAESGAEVGRSAFVVPPSTERTSVVREVVRTTELAVTGELVGCNPGSDEPTPPPAPGS